MSSREDGEKIYFGREISQEHKRISLVLAKSI